jgi:hypothetical protein
MQWPSWKQNVCGALRQTNHDGGMRGELLEAERVQSIVGAFFTVYNYYGYGLSESVYAGAYYRFIDFPKRRSGSIRLHWSNSCPDPFAPPRRDS